jgi:LacI family transcriptional regulator
MNGKKNISLILPDLTQPEFLYLFQYLQQAVSNSCFNLNAFGTDDSVEQYCKIISDQIDEEVSSIVLVPPLSGSLPVELLIRLYESNIPVLTCFRAIEGFGWPVVRVDQAYNTKIAAKHLCEIGRKNIGLVSVDVPESYNDLIKEYTFINTLDEFGLATKKSLRLILSRSNRNDPEKRMWLFNAIENVENWISDHPEIDGICCLHDMGAWAVLSALAKAGKRVPEDIAVVGNGNMLDFFGFAKNDLTTVDCCYDNFGKEILKFVEAVTSDKKYEQNTSIEVKGKLILRYSTQGALLGSSTV